MTDAAGEPIGAPLGGTGGIAAVGETLYVVPSDPVTREGTELWRSDGTAAGTSLVADIRRGPEGSWGEIEAVVRGTLYLNDDQALWRSDGTADGTVLVKDVNDPAMQIHTPLTVVGNGVYLDIESCERAELWRTDAATRETIRLLRIRP